MASKVHYPSHFWQIHKKVWQREWMSLERATRKEILNDTQCETAKEFFAFVHKLAVEFFEDGNHNYNSRHRFQYSP